MSVPLEHVVECVSSQNHLKSIKSILLANSYVLTDKELFKADLQQSQVLSLSLVVHNLSVCLVHAQLCELNFRTEERNLFFTDVEHRLYFTSQRRHRCIQLRLDGLLLHCNLVKDFLHEFVRYKVLGEVCLCTCNLVILSSWWPLFVYLKLMNFWFLSVWYENWLMTNTFAREARIRVSIPSKLYFLVYASIRDSFALRVKALTWDLLAIQLMQVKFKIFLHSRFLFFRFLDS